MRTLALVVTSLLTAVALFTLDAPVLGQRSPAIQSARTDAQVIGLACAPTAATSVPNSTLRVTGGQDSQVRLNFSQGEFVTVNAGTNQGLKVGQEFFVRRMLAPRGYTVTARTPATIQTVGWVRVYAVDEDMSLATITHNCDAMRVGDYLEALVLPTALKFGPTQGRPERVYARVIMGNERRSEFGAGDFVVVDSGSSKGVSTGTQFVIYRWKTKAPDNFLAAIGEGRAVEVTEATTTVMLTASRDSVMVGDLAAMRK